jgi:hypothetical protein
MALFKLGDALKQFVQSSKIKNGIRAAQIEEVWSEIMGTTIAKYTDKIYIFDKIIFYINPNKLLSLKLYLVI